MGPPQAVEAYSCAFQGSNLLMRSQDDLRSYKHMYEEKTGENCDLSSIFLHAEVRCATNQHSKLEHLCRYIT